MNIWQDGFLLSDGTRTSKEDTWSIIRQYKAARGEEIFDSTDFSWNGEEYEPTENEFMELFDKIYDNNVTGQDEVDAVYEMFGEYIE